MQCTKCGKGMTWISGPKPTNCPTCGGALGEDRKSIAETLSEIWDGMLGLFRPRWRSSNPDVRKAAVRKLTDQVLLARIGRYDSEWSVQAVAVETLTDEAALEEFIKNDSALIGGHLGGVAAKRLRELREPKG